MALFSPSESVYITSFLSAVDLDSSISPDGSVDPGVADRVPHLQGREALAKATKDLMSLDVPVSSHHHHNPSHQGHLPQGLLSNGPSYWPSIPGAEPAHQSQRQSSSPASSSSIFSSQHSFSQPHVQIAPLRGFDPSSSSPVYTLPPITANGFPNGLNGHEGALARPAAVPSSTSAPSVLSSTSTSAKRPLPSSSQPATDPSSSKRLRASPSSSGLFASAPDADSPSGSGSGTAAARPRRGLPSQGQSRSTQAVPQVASGSSSAHGSSGGGGTGAGGGSTGGANNKGTLLSPSQKRANHIQSEQKRRANIRRGYEALCEVVPALREAIRAEEDRERAKDRERDSLEEGSSLLNGKGKTRAGGVDKGKKKKGRGEEKPDGRAGPRSENVVLQKTIDYITGLIAERSALQQRLELSRSMLPLGHPALSVEPRHLDLKGIPLWEREWNGGMDLDIADLGGAQDEECSEDES